MSSPWKRGNFRIAWAGAPLLSYFLYTFLLVSVVLIGQFFITTLAGFAFAKVQFPGKDLVFILVLMQLFILPEVLIVENYVMVSRLGLFDTILGVGMPYMASRSEENTSALKSLMRISKHASSLTQNK